METSLQCWMDKLLHLYHFPKTVKLWFYAGKHTGTECVGTKLPEKREKQCVHHITLNVHLCACQTGYHLPFQ